MARASLTLSLAAGALAALACAGAAEAQSMRFRDPSGCPDAGMAGKLSRAQVDVERAEDLVKARKGYLNAVAAMDDAKTRAELARLKRQLDTDRTDLRRGGPNPMLQARVADTQSRHDLLLEAVTRAMLGDKINPARNPYLAQIRAAEAELATQQAAYRDVAVGCGFSSQPATTTTTTPRQPPRSPEDGGPPIIYGTPAVGTPIDSLRTAEGRTPPQTRPSTPTRSQPPTPQTTSRATPEAYQEGRLDGRLQMKPMSEEDTRAMAAVVTPGGRVAESGRDVDFSSWNGRYTDGGDQRFEFFGGASILQITGGPDDFRRLWNIDWRLCKEASGQISCDVRGNLRERTGEANFGGKLVARRGSDGVTVTYTFQGVTPVRGNVTLRAGQSITVRYQRL